MSTLKEKAADFLAQKRIAVTGVSTSGENTANGIYRRLRERGYEAFAINPKGGTFEGDTCYPDLAAIPGGVDAVVIVNRPEVTEQIVRQCAELGIKRVWMHRSMEMAGSSVSDEAVRFCEEQGITVIPGACPMMFGQMADFGHRCMRWTLGLMGKLPK